MTIDLRTEEVCHDSLVSVEPIYQERSKRSLIEREEKSGKRIRFVNGCSISGSLTTVHLDGRSQNSLILEKIFLD